MRCTCRPSRRSAPAAGNPLTTYLRKDIVMPITDLTDRVPDTPTLVRFGKIRKGGPKPESGKRPGPDLKHFRITLESAYEHLAPMIAAGLGDEPREIPIVFVGETVDEVFPYLVRSVACFRPSAPMRWRHAKARRYRFRAIQGRSAVPAR